MVSGATNNEITFDEFSEMAVRGDVDKVSVVNGQVARIYIKDTKIESGDHTNLPKSSFGGRAHYTLIISSPERFDEKVATLRNDLSDDSGTTAVSGMSTSDGGDGKLLKQAITAAGAAPPAPK